MGELSKLRRDAGGIGFPSDYGVLGWTAPIDFARDASLLSVEGGAGHLRVGRIRRANPGPLTNLNVHVTTAGSGLSNCFAALWRADTRALIGQTADQSANWQTAGLKPMALVGGPFDLAAGDYYAGVWYNGTTAPTLLRAGLGLGGGMGNLFQTADQWNCLNHNGGYTTAAPATLPGGSQSILRWWFALS